MNNDLLYIIFLSVVAGLFLSKKSLKNIIFAIFFVVGILSCGLTLKPVNKVYFGEKLEVRLVQVNATDCDPKTDDKCDPD